MCVIVEREGRTRVREVEVRRERPMCIRVRASTALLEEARRQLAEANAAADRERAANTLSLIHFSEPT